MDDSDESKSVMTDKTMSAIAGAVREGDPEELAKTYLREQTFAREAYAMLPFLWRLRLNDVGTLTSQVLVPIGFGAWLFLLPTVKLAGISLFPSAYADVGITSPFDPRPIIHLAIFLALFTTFIVSIWVNYFSKSEKAIDHASTVSKTLLGFFIGVATNYLGVASSG